MHYEPKLESVQQHPVPEWYHDAKLGIFIHWGLYSVPAWAPLTGEMGQVLASGGWAKWFAENPYAEWYLNSIRTKGSPSYRHHVETYGPDFDYAEFATAFNRGLQTWDPGTWADLFRRVGARYVVLTTKHHDGFLLWPSAHPNPYKAGYMADRDVVGDLTQAVRARGMRMGLYYSGGLDWTFNPTVIRGLEDFAAAIPQTTDYVTYANNHWRELIARYQPSILWNDIAYPAATDLNELFADYYNTIPEGLVNDRFTQQFDMSGQQVTGSRHTDFSTPEYTSFSEITDFKWEATRGIGFSFGYNQNEGPEHYLSIEDLIHSFVDIVSKNGNLLLNVGPMVDGALPELQRERLLGLGKWLDVNGAAIFGSRPWVTAEGQTGEGLGVRYTQRAGKLYATVLGGISGGHVRIKGLQVQDGTVVRLLGNDRPLDWQQEKDGLALSLPGPLPSSVASAFEIAPLPDRAGVLSVRSKPLNIDSKLAELLKDEASKAVLAHYLGEMLDSPQIEMAMNFSLPQIASFVPNVLTAEVLEQIDRDLKSLPEKGS